MIIFIIIIIIIITISIINNHHFNQQRIENIIMINVLTTNQLINCLNNFFYRILTMIIYRLKKENKCNQQVLISD